MTPSTFLRLAGPLLERDEARNQLPLGIAGTLTARPDAYDVVHFWVVRDGDEPVAAAVRTEPFNLVLGDPSSDAALGSLLEAVAGRRPRGARHLGQRAVRRAGGRTARAARAAGPPNASSPRACTG